MGRAVGRVPVFVMDQEGRLYRIVENPKICRIRNGGGKTRFERFGAVTFVTISTETCQVLLCKVAL
jgi:hypothetical protein